MDELNKEQEEAANFFNGKASVIAVPGSGKTRTMMERIGRLITVHNIQPSAILGLTFTKNAAEEMRQRLELILGAQASKVMLSTIHSFCHYLLKHEGKVYDILSAGEQVTFIRKIIKENRCKDVPVGTALREISLAKNNLIMPDDFREIYPGDRTMQAIADVYEAYELEKRKRSVLDFDDLLVEVYNLLSNNNQKREKYRNIYRHLLVDEFQDTNPLQIELLRALVSEEEDSSFWACGDDWQSIYGFTGASVGGILQFKEMFHGSREFILSMNYRSTPQILKGCQNLIMHNQRKKDKTLRTEKPDGEEIVVLECGSEEDEAVSIIREIYDLTERRGFKNKDIAVLYRANFQSRVLEEAFSLHKVPYRIENGLNFYTRPEVRNLIDYVRLVKEPNSDVGDEALKRVINVPNRYAGRSFVTELEQYAITNGLRLYEALRSLPIQLPYIKRNIKAFLAMMDPLMGLGEHEPADVISLLRETLDYDKYIEDTYITSPDDTKLANINQLITAAAKYKDLNAFLEHVESLQQESSSQEEGVSFMTVHKAKGLEFQVVFLVGLVEGILPTKKGDTEEERRICFVGISRAMSQLYLCYSHTYLGQPAKKSIFLDEIMGTGNTAL